MTVRHEALRFPRGIVLRRRHCDGRDPIASYWGGREAGWIPTSLEAMADAKAYKTHTIAREALGRILEHEKALGIHRRIGRRY